MNEKNNEKPKGRELTLIMGNGFPIARKKISRNQPCECGSGRKAKHCCGTETVYVYSKLNSKQLKEKNLLAEARESELAKKQETEHNPVVQ